MQRIGFTDKITVDELGHLDHALTAALAAVDPLAIEFRHLTIQREAVYLKAHPAAALTLLRRGAHDAVPSILGAERFTETRRTWRSSRPMSASGISPTTAPPSRSQQR
jgi:hypothetical protein